MILRRFIEHVQAQNWFAVGLDVIVVIVGIFLGMQVTDWNEDRGERLDEQRYLAELETDLGHALQEIDETIDNARMRVAAGAFIFEGKEIFEVGASFKSMASKFALKEGLEAAPENHLPLIISITRIVDKHGDTYAELVATGNIGVLRDRSLVRELSQYYSRYDEIQTGDQINWTQMKLAQEMFQNHGIAMAQPMKPSDFMALIEENSQLNAAVRNVTSLAGWQIMRLMNLRTDTEAILARVREART